MKGEVYRRRVSTSSMEDKKCVPVKEVLGGTQLILDPQEEEFQITKKQICSVRKLKYGLEMRMPLAWDTYTSQSTLTVGESKTMRKCTKPS